MYTLSTPVKIHNVILTIYTYIDTIHRAVLFINTLAMLDTSKLIHYFG